MPKIPLELIHTKITQWRQNKGQNASYIMYNSECYKESQELGQNQNVSWDELGQLQYDLREREHLAPAYDLSK